MNAFLIIVCVVMSVVVLAGIAYLMILFSSPDDKNQAWLPKVVVVFGLSLACFCVLLLPLDVSNKIDPLRKGDAGGGLNLAVLWQICLMVIVILVVAIVPFCTFYYEAYEPDQEGISGQIKAGLGYTAATVIVYLLIMFILWGTVGIAVIPVTKSQSPMVPWTEDTWTPECPTCFTDSNATLELRVSPVIYAIAIICFVGWIQLIFFGGSGMASLPIDMILGWYHRPRPMSINEYSAEKSRIANISEELMTNGKELEHKVKADGLGRKIKKEIHVFKLAVTKLKQDLDKCEISYRDAGGSPFIAWSMLLLGIITGVIAILWILHILLNNAANVAPFLNTMFIGLDRAWGFLGTIAYSIFTFYLLWALFKGVIAVGTRFPWFSIHPMKPHDTLMNAFLFNTLIILLGSVPVTQFASQSFRSYASHTAVDSLFQTYIANLKGIGVVFGYFQYALLAVVLISFVLLLICPYKPSYSS
eukprot:NODE_2502_length_1564_cov_85.503817_g2155_i0.p1 GENE.NODE_2502_length_1564_cov_85.503817_g2155_i0~~NODE_2502_length_1564_cov_85.503817_g2155_i0.p1  ORF type:complete len:491 (-),score=50.20 NODE_2502_length_1564_cov_85.503817_g2155_i0:91-1512(-)